jgi:hypothetical protein
MKTETRCLVDFEIEQLKRLISLAKKGTMCKSDRELIEWLELKSNSLTYQTYQGDYDEIDIDAIPF